MKDFVFSTSCYHNLTSLFLNNSSPILSIVFRNSWRLIGYFDLKAGYFGKKWNFHQIISCHWPHWVWRGQFCQSWPESLGNAIIGGWRSTVLLLSFFVKDITYFQINSIRILFRMVEFFVMFSVTYPDFVWADQYTHRTHESTAMVGTERRNFQNLCLQIL